MRIENANESWVTLEALIEVDRSRRLAMPIQALADCSFLIGGEHETPDEKKERIERQQKKRRKGYYSAESRDKRNQEIYVEKNQEMMERVHSLSSSGTIETLDLFALMTMGRCSEQWFEGGYGEMIVGNDEFADHYIEQFFGGILPISRGSVAFNFTKAWMSFPTVHPGRGLQPLLPDANTNRLCQAIWIEHLEGIPPGQTAILLFRGIDGGSIDPAAWMGLLNRWPGIHIEIAFACETTFVTARAPANANWFMRARPYDGFLYWQFPLAELVATMIGNRQDAKYTWLLSEWALGWQARIDSEIANQSRNAARIIAASLVYRNLRTRGRTGLSNDQKGDTY
jgi:hypothetical protein